MYPSSLLPEGGSARCIDPRSDSFAYMSVIVVQCIYKSWIADTMWTAWQSEAMKQMFGYGHCYDK